MRGKPGLYLLLIPAVLVFTISWVLWSNVFQEKNKTVKIQFQNTYVFADVADTEEKRYRGLSGRKSMSDREGMIFLFTEYAKPVFVMREMNFPIDIIWLKDGVIQEITKNVLPQKTGEILKPYIPSQEVNMVIEVQAGLSERFDIAAGQRAEIHF